MKPWGILMSAPMVLALLDGRKTVTRRTSGRWARCGVGRVLWVRETWQVLRPLRDWETGAVEEVEMWSGSTRQWPPHPWQVWYGADSDDLTLHPDDRLVRRWRPGIHMPEWASRIRRRTVNVTREEWPGVPMLSQAEAEREGFDSPDAFAALWVEINGPVGGVVYRIEMAEVQP